MHIANYLVNRCVHTSGLTDHICSCITPWYLRSIPAEAVMRLYQAGMGMRLHSLVAQLLLFTENSHVAEGLDAVSINVEAILHSIM